MSITYTGLRGIKMNPLVHYDETAYTGFGPVPTPCTVRAFQNATYQQKRSQGQETSPIIWIIAIGGVVWLLSRK